jgi:hypothetical protein
VICHSLTAKLVNIDKLLIITIGQKGVCGFVESLFHNLGYINKSGGIETVASCEIPSQG